LLLHRNLLPALPDQNVRTAGLGESFQPTDGDSWPVRYSLFTCLSPFNTTQLQTAMSPQFINHANMD